MKATAVDGDRDRRPSTQMDRRRCFALCAFLAFVACDSNRDAARRVQAMTVPAGDGASELSGPLTNSQSVAFTWDVDSRLSWDQYEDWVTARLTPSFRLVQRTTDRIVFAQNSAGDTRRLTIAVVGSYAITHAHATFTSSPD